MSQESEMNPTAEAQTPEQELDQQAQQGEETTQTAPEQDEQQKLLTQIAALKTDVAAEKDRALRAMAEADNSRRRAAQDVEKAHKFALEKFSNELLPVIDNLELALKHADRDNADLNTMVEGVELTLKSFMGVCERFGIQVIDPQGEALDPNKHQAVSVIEKEDVAPNTVIDVMQKGYELNGRVLRPAMVLVSKTPVGA